MSPALPSPRNLVTVLGLVLMLAGLGCRADTTGLSTLSIEEFSALRGSSTEVAVFDANTDETRAKNGVIPGAVLLTSYRDYDPTAELPSDRARQLVFYCHSAMCGAAVDAARKAVAAGWQDVWVMPDGIRGWTEAGLPVERRAAG